MCRQSRWPPIPSLGTYTNFVNLLGWSAIAIPAARLPSGLPFGITLIAPAGANPIWCAGRSHWKPRPALTAGATGRPTRTQGALPSLARAHPGRNDCADRGRSPPARMPLNHELLLRGARFREATDTASHYRLYALQQHGVPAKPGLAQAVEGAAIAVEVWDMPIANLGRFVVGIPAPLGIAASRCRMAAASRASSAKVRPWRMPRTSPITCVYWLGPVTL